MVLPWPSQSPNLNVIENLGSPGITELEDFCKEQWAKIPQTRARTLA